MDNKDKKPTPAQPEKKRTKYVPSPENMEGVDYKEFPEEDLVDLEDWDNPKHWQTDEEKSNKAS